MASASALCSLPPELLARVGSLAGRVEELGRLDCVAHAFHSVQPALNRSVVEEALRLRAAERGHAVAATLPAGEASWTQWFCWEERRDRVARRAVAACGELHSAFIDAEGRLLTCGGVREEDDPWNPAALGHGEGVTRLEVPTIIPALSGVRIRSVAASSDHTLAVAADGRAFSWGDGDNGRLGHGDKRNQLTPRPIAALRRVKVVAIATGAAHSLLLADNGLVFSCGHGIFGRLGHGPLVHNDAVNGNEEPQLTPRPIEALRGVKVVAIAAGMLHTLLLADDGLAYSCGYGRLGQLGHGDKEDRYTPRPIEALRGVNVVAIAAGDTHSLLLVDDGLVYAFGEGVHGQLGHGDEDEYTPRPIEVLAGVKVVAVAAGAAHSLLLADSGIVYSCGHGEGGQLGQGPMPGPNLYAPRPIKALAGVKVAAVAAGWRHSLAVAADGRAFGWGSSPSSGVIGFALGLQLEAEQSVPLQYPRLRIDSPCVAGGAGAAREPTDDIDIALTRGASSVELS